MRCPIDAQTSENQLMGQSGKAAVGNLPTDKALHVAHFAPLADTPRPRSGVFWGTRGPEFKSRRPDHRKTCRRGSFLEYGSRFQLCLWPDSGPDVSTDCRDARRNSGAKSAAACPMLQGSALRPVASRQAEGEEAAQGRKIGGLIGGSASNVSRIEIEPPR